MRRTLFIIFLLFAKFVTGQTISQSKIPTQVTVSSDRVSHLENSVIESKNIWDEVEPFVNGYSRVLLDNKFSFVNISGKLISPVVFEAARNFSYKLAAVKKDAKWGFINESGQVVIPFQYEIVFDFKELITGAFINGKWVLINLNGDFTKGLDITVFHGFNQGIANIEKDGRHGTINTRGEIKWNQEEKKATTTNKISYAATASRGATNCPDNIDFEFGSFLNWKCFTGRVDSVGNTNVITVTPSAPTNNRHTLYNRILPSRIDPYGLFPTNPPDGSNFAVKLGNTQIGAQAERIQYPIRVPLNDSNFSIKYDYAVVFEDPGHTTWTQPRFTVRLLDSATNTYVDCASFEYISTSNLPGFARSTVDTGVVYKPWSTVFVSLRGHAGKTMYLEFTTADCVRRGHWGYAYVDVEKPCGQSVQLQYECTSPNITTLDAPPGFQLYNWWNSNFSNLYGTGQHVVLNPGPPVNTIIWLEMIPYNNFGCKDTIPVKITGVFNANFSISDTTAVCAPHTFTFYNGNIPSTVALWNFGDGTAGTGDTITHTYSLPGNYTVTLNVVLPSGCIGTVQKVVSIVQPVGTFYFNGTYYCNNQVTQFDAVVNNADSLFWDFGDGTLLATTLPTVFHTYNLPGLYYPYLTVQSAFGCHNTLPGPDTIRIEKLQAGFFETQRKNCGSTTVNFSDTSYAYFGINSYQWNFGDGTTGSGNTVSHTYTVAGTYNIQLIITGISGCKDTIVKPVQVSINPKPVATITGPGTQCQSVPVTFNSMIQSTDAINLIQWIASNGSTGSGNSFTVNFPLPGNYTIQLIAGTVNGCFDTTTKQIIINQSAVVEQPDDLVLCNGAMSSVIPFTGTVSGTLFSWTNDNPSIGLASSGTGSINAFTVINNTNATVTATVTVSPIANGCPGPAKSFTITVNPEAGMLQPADQILCNGAASGNIAFTSASGSSSFNWMNNNSSIGLGASGSGDISSFTAINHSNIPVSAIISVTVVSNNCPGQTKTFSIIVNPTPEVEQPVSQVLCTGSTTTAVSFSSNINNSSFNWTNNNTSIGLNAGGSGVIDPFMGINTNSVPITAQIIVIPTAIGCPGPSKTFTITVNPAPAMLQPNTQTICTASLTDAITFSGNVTGTIYNWINNNPSIGLAANGTGNIASFSGNNHSDTVATAMITVTPVANSCPGPSINFMIIVKPSPNVIQPDNQALCNRSITAPVIFTTTLTGSTFTWTNNNTGIGLAATGTGNIDPFPAINNTDAAIIALINVTALANGCTGPVKTVIITVNPTPTIIASNNMNVCLGSSVQLTATGGAQYIWSPANLLSCTDCANPVSTPVDSIRYVVQGTSNAGCRAFDTVLLTVIKPFRMLVGRGDSLCVGKSTGLKAMQANTYLWSPPAGLNHVNIAEPTATPQVTTTYQVVGYDAYHCFTDTGRITVVVGPIPIVEIGPDISTQTGTAITLHPETQNGPIVSWLWTPATDLSCTDCPAPVANIRNNITYDVTIRNIFGCVATDRIRINVFCKSAQVYIPNAFTPDGDGLNDILMVRGTGITVKTFRIFNRWGELVFERKNFNANDPKYGWDGKVRGVPATPDVFVYTAEVLCDNGMSYIYKGNTTVLK